MIIFVDIFKYLSVSFFLVHTFDLFAHILKKCKFLSKCVKVSS